MSAPTITLLEALRRLIAEVKQLDAVEVGARWNQLQGELGVAEGVLRDYVEPDPIGWRLQGPENYGITSYDKEQADNYIKNLGYKLVQQIYAAQPSESQPVPEGWIDFNDKNPQEDQLVLICGVIPSDVQTEVKGWRCLARFKGGDLLDMNGCTRNSATHWTMLIDSFADGYAAPTAAVSAAPSGEVLIPINPTDEILRRMLAVRWPATYREHLRHPDTGPHSRKREEEEIAEAGKQYSAIVAAITATKE